MRDKKGLSAIVMTVIMVGLVLVAVGIVWVVVLNILEGQSASLDLDQKCLGLSFEISSANCGAINCTVDAARKTGSKGHAIDGAEITVKNGQESKTEDWQTDIVDETITVVDANLGASDSTIMRIYFIKEDGERHYCSEIFKSA